MSFHSRAELEPPRRVVTATDPGILQHAGRPLQLAPKLVVQNPDIVGFVRIPGSTPRQNVEIPLDRIEQRPGVPRPPHGRGAFGLRDAWTIPRGMYPPGPRSRSHNRTPSSC